jgi:hypothetical protein
MLRKPPIGIPRGSEIWVLPADVTVLRMDGR